MHPHTYAVLCPGRCLPRAPQQGGCPPPCRTLLFLSASLSAAGDSRKVTPLVCQSILRPPQNTRDPCSATLPYAIPPDASSTISVEGTTKTFKWHLKCASTSVRLTYPHCLAGVNPSVVCDHRHARNTHVHNNSAQAWAPSPGGSSSRPCFILPIMEHPCHTQMPPSPW